MGVSYTKYGNEWLSEFTRISKNGRIKRNRQVCILSLKIFFLVGYGSIGKFDVCLTYLLKKKKAISFSLVAKTPVAFLAI